MFVPVWAETDDQREEAYRLRYQVFCIETGIFDPAKNPGELERDEFDDHAVQGLLLHRATGMTVGTVRLVLPRAGAKTGCLPIHRVCRDPRIFDRDFLPLNSTFELGRFAISKTLRRRIDDGSVSSADGPDHKDDDPTRVLPHICLSLLTIALQMGIAHGIETVCAVMEPSLLRLVERFGFHFNKLGPEVSYYGLRQPVYGRVGPMLRAVRQERPDIWGLITDRGRLWPARLENQPAAAESSFAEILP